MTDATVTARLAELEADNRRLRRLLDERDAPSELRHRLRNTVALLRTIIRRSAQTERDLDDYIGHMEDRLDALARTHASADDHGVVDFRQLIVDELFHYGASEGSETVLAGPSVELEPWAGQVLALAVHELVVNAVEHGALGAGTGRLAVTWEVSGPDDPVLKLIWREEGQVQQSPPTHQGFGTEVLTRTLAYELKSTAEPTFDARGVQWTIQFPLPGRVGRVRAD